jgi:hypothetical protein
MQKEGYYTSNNFKTDKLTKNKIGELLTLMKMG